jgi:hypothetical protein
MNTARFNLTLPPSMLSELHSLSNARGEAITTILRSTMRGLIDCEKTGRRYCVTGEPCFFSARNVHPESHSFVDLRTK